MEVIRVGVTPVKGARHTAGDSLVLDEHGAVGDRTFCFIDAASRQVLRTVQQPRLLAMLARWDGAVLTIELPSGASVTGAPQRTGHVVESDYWGRRVGLELVSGEYAELVSAYLGFPVLLASAPRGQVIYGGPVSLVTVASLRRLSSEVGLPPGALDPARFRATLVLQAGDEPFVEDGWAGRELGLGEARIRVAEPIPRCAVVDLDPTTGVPDVAVLRGLGELRPRQGPRRLSFGWDAEVTSPGVVRPGDRLRLG